VSERYAEQPGESWLPLDEAAYELEWSRFESRYGFHASTTPDAWPAISEPLDSLTFDVSVIDGRPSTGCRLRRNQRRVAEMLRLGARRR
jgi:hypothetical protein